METILTPANLKYLERVMTQQAMPNPVELFQKATSGLNQVLSGIQQDQINAQTPAANGRLAVCWTT